MKAHEFQEDVVTEIPFLLPIWKKDCVGRQRQYWHMFDMVCTLARSCFFGANADKPVSLGSINIKPDFVGSVMFSLLDLPREHNVVTGRKGFLDAKDLERLEKALGLAWGRERMFLFFSMIDRDGDTHLSKASFERHFTYMKVRMRTEAQADVEYHPSEYSGSEQAAEPERGSDSRASPRTERLMVATAKAEVAAARREQMLAIANFELTLKEKQMRKLPPLPASIRTGLEAMFALMDKDGSRYLDEAEMGDVTYALRQYWSKTDNEILMSIGDRNGEILQPAFVRYMSQVLLMAFDRVDADHSGTLDIEELKLVADAFQTNHADMVASFAQRHQSFDPAGLSVGPDEFIQFVVEESMLFKGADDILHQGMTRARAKYDVEDRMEAYPGEFAKKIGREQQRLEQHIVHERRSYMLTGLLRLIQISSEYKVKVRDSQLQIVKEIRRVQRQAWGVRDNNTKREASKYLLAELDVDLEADADDEDNSNANAYDGTRFGRNVLWEELRTAFGDGYESYEGNPKSEHEKARRQKLVETMENMERQQKLYNEMKADEEEAAIMNLGKAAEEAKAKAKKRIADAEAANQRAPT